MSGRIHIIKVDHINISIVNTHNPSSIRSLNKYNIREPSVVLVLINKISL